ncbi:oligopeptide transport system permease protein [Tissierella praeacuta DSM 18095]|uniref:Oligopeptide transport system permease protein n=1 Tax=Tissierella praeacuta DSM 18095 TaxID=1123404 RepID=A0A1M4X4A9_9FIRM|nr:ABC transporter permease [Tissierella praeacuta]SHE88193.1 oligopeptide transport system permease protein [Tissierella praeacuta DSM 18095]SUO99698.1 Oligopeptide transport system permease protein oppB [Tissierella praeacuta]
MGKYIMKRIGYMLLTLWIVVTITFFLMHSIPGDPLAHMAKNLPEQIKLNYYQKYGLDKPVIVQYGTFMKNLITKGDLGESLRYPGRLVTETVLTNAKVSGRLGMQAISLGIVIGITLGIIAALNRNKWPDYLVMFIAILGITVPVFIIAALLQYTLSVKFELLPTTGWGKFKHTILPTIAMCFGSIATYGRYMRSNVLEVINQDYILTAQAKGVSPFNVVRKHVLRNAILPVITILGPQIAGIFTGSFVIERIFGIPGLGSYYITSINDRDYTMIIGTTVFYAALFVVAQLAVDLLYGVADPRIRVSKNSK